MNKYPAVADVVSALANPVHGRERLVNLIQCKLERGSQAVETTASTTTTAATATAAAPLWRLLLEVHLIKLFGREPSAPWGRYNYSYVL